MSIIEIKHRNGTILHTIEADSIKAAVEELNLRGADLSGADLSGADLSGANLIRADLSGADMRATDLSGTDLSGADLSGADLGGAYLSGTELSGTDLSGATYDDGIPFTKIPVMISGLTWNVRILDSHLKICCELHSFNEWENFTDKQIAKMKARAALSWWKIYKAPIMALIKAVRP